MGRSREQDASSKNGKDSGNTKTPRLQTQVIQKKGRRSLWGERTVRVGTWNDQGGHEMERRLWTEFYGTNELIE